MIARVRESKMPCPMCGNHLKTDNVKLWCENPECEFTALYGELVHEKPPAAPKTRKRRSQ